MRKMFPFDDVIMIPLRKPFMDHGMQSMFDFVLQISFYQKNIMSEFVHIELSMSTMLVSEPSTAVEKYLETFLILDMQIHKLI